MRQKTSEQVEYIIEDLRDRGLYYAALESVNNSKNALRSVLFGESFAKVVSDRKRVIGAVRSADPTMSNSLIAKIMMLDTSTVRKALKGNGNADEATRAE